MSNDFSFGQTGGGGGSGTVTNFSFVNANGFTGTVSNSTTTPALTLTGAPSIVKPAFSAVLTTSATNVTGDGTVFTVPFDTLLFDTNSGYDISTFVYAIPVTGNYTFNTNLLLNNINSTHTFSTIEVPLDAPGGSLVIQLAVNNPFATAGLLGGTVSGTSQGTWTMDMTAGEEVNVTLRVIGGTKTVGLQGFSSPQYCCTFSGFMT